MDSLKPELTSLLREAGFRRDSNVTTTDTDLIFPASTGLAGLASIAGGFDQVLLAAGGGGSSLSFPDNSTFLSKAVTTAASADAWIISTRDKMHCGHFAQMHGGKLHFTMDATETCRFWTEGVVSSGVAGFGLIGNLLSIWVLSMPEMRSTAFNRLLLALAIIDSLFICPGILIYTSKGFAWKTDWYNKLFPIFLYPFSEMALCSSIYMTVAIAVERYIGLCRPLQRLSWRPCSAKVYIFPVLAIAVLLNIPKFLESETIYRRDPFTNVTWTQVGVTDLRMHPHYITYYWMWTRLLATGVIPLVLLALLNSKIFLAIRRSKQQLRSLAIRSALPMAILAGNGTNGSTAQIPDLRIDSPSSSLQNGHVGRNGYRRKRCQKNAGLIEDDCDANKEINPRIVTFAVASPPANPETPEVRLVSSRAPRRTLIQRSVSAFVPTSSNRNGVTSESMANGKFSSKLLRSHSAATAAAATPLVTTTSNGSAASEIPQSNINSDLNLAPILFGVVIVFVGCNFLRVVLNIYDFAVVDSIIDCESRGVGRLPPPWILCSISVSHLFLMVNSSVNFLVYCVAGTRFRGVLGRKCRHKLASIRDFFRVVRRKIGCKKESESQEMIQVQNRQAVFEQGVGRNLVPGRSELVKSPRINKSMFTKDRIPENARTLLPDPRENVRTITRL